MKLRLSIAGLAACLAAGMAGCTTTEEANQAIQGRWIGQSSDAFFSQYGPPASQFPLNGGGTIYTWRGGETDRNIPAQYRPTTKQELELEKKGPRTIINIGGDMSMDRAPPGQVLVSQARTEQLGCEAQITTNPAGVITAIRASRDTDGEGFSLSRCAEVFGVTN
ncbi:hypothetical protein [Aurantimonas sp. VKM B-3413]|uniref:hypothetical protein n=1 Tax=Aurantimonas sp. VKM B-3413 TaxID=2779401 RepID=UPI001E6357C9|nr:hypothetical protein [Aurantimonas sp. VKM B-3413]MCB8837215.1 hypothetical protein [Aurantimonas sp. VKM B-3413]